MPYEEALSGFERFEFAEAHYACPVYRKGGGGMGDSTTRFRIWGWRAASRTRAKRRKPERRFRTSSHCGRTPTPTFLFFDKRKLNTPSCLEKRCIPLAPPSPTSGACDRYGSRTLDVILRGTSHPRQR
jgi:hypothetical protein